MRWVRRSGVSWAVLGHTVGLAVCLLSAGSCGELLTATRSPGILVIERIGAASGGRNEDPYCHAAPVRCPVLWPVRGCV